MSEARFFTGFARVLLGLVMLVGLWAAIIGGVSALGGEAWGWPTFLAAVAALAWSAALQAILALLKRVVNALERTA